MNASPERFPNEMPGGVTAIGHGTTWTLVELGTDQVGCSKVPIKPLTQIGSECSGG